jgi:hypothetical protein
MGVGIEGVAMTDFHTEEDGGGLGFVQSWQLC